MTTPSSPTSYFQSQTGTVALQNLDQTVVVQLRLPTTTGAFAVWGNVTLASPASATSVQSCSVSITTLDGATQLASTEVLVPTPGAQGAQCVALHGILNLSQPNANEIVDIRCAMQTSGSAFGASLLAIAVGIGQPAPS